MNCLPAADLPRSPHSQAFWTYQAAHHFLAVVGLADLLYHPAYPETLVLMCSLMACLLQLRGGAVQSEIAFTP